MRQSVTFSVSLPPAMSRQVERAMKAEHRTRSELVREALRTYLSASLSRTEPPTRAEARAYREGIAGYQRGAEATLRGDDNGSDRPRLQKNELAEFFEAMAANSKKIPPLPDSVFARDSFYKDHD
jgi:Arc/MetJ-type ribon-helix-helix transcriptional regulator